MKKLKVLLGVVLVLVLTGLGGFYYWIGTPLYSLYLLRQGIRNGDREAVYRHLDVSEILKHNVERSLNLLPPGLDRFPRRAATVLIPLAEPLVQAQIDQQLGHPERSPLTGWQLQEVRYQNPNAYITLKNPTDNTTTVLVMAPISDRQWKIVDIDLSQAILGFSLDDVQP